MFGILSAFGRSAVAKAQVVCESGTFQAYKSPLEVRRGAEAKKRRKAQKAARRKNRRK